MATKKKPAVKKAPKETAPEVIAEEPQAVCPPPQAEKPQAVMPETLYQKYVDLKFLSFQAKFEEPTKKELERLEKEVKAINGEKAVRTVRAAIGTEQLKLVEGIALPESYLKIIKGAGEKAIKFYLG